MQRRGLAQRWGQGGAWERERSGGRAVLASHSADLALRGSSTCGSPPSTAFLLRLDRKEMSPLVPKDLSGGNRRERERWKICRCSRDLACPTGWAEPGSFHSVCSA